MSKLLFIYERDMPTVSITREVFSHLQHYPSIKSDFVYLSDVSKDDIDSHDVIIFIRPDNSYSWKIAKKARESGHTVVTFCDDDLLNLPKNTPTIPWRKKGLLKALANSNVIWSSSKYILDKYIPYTFSKRTAVIDTIVQQNEFNNITFNDSACVKIVYAAAPSHKDLFNKLISPIIPKLVQEFGERISFTFISVHPDVEGIRCEYLPGMPLLEYRKYMKDQHFDIGVAPLFNNEFTKCKYFNKFLEYTTKGVLGIYSKTEPYTYVIEEGINGLLAEDNPESWYNALSKAIKDSQFRHNCVNNAIQYIKDNHSEKACIEKFVKGIPEILNADQEYKKCKVFSFSKYFYYMTRPFDWTYLLFFYLKNTGIKAVINRIKIHFVEVKAYARKR